MQQGFINNFFIEVSTLEFFAVFFRMKNPFLRVLTPENPPQKTINTNAHADAFRYNCILTVKTCHIFSC